MNKRIKLKKGYQRRLIENAKEKNKISWKELGKLLKISSDYLRLDLRLEKRYISQELYDKLSEISGLNYNRLILERLDKNWGRSKGGKLSKPKEKQAKKLVNNYSIELAEFIGVMLGDGNIWERKGFYYVRVCGHSIEDKEYLINHIKPLIKKIFNINMQTYIHKTNNELYLTKGSKDFVFTLKNYGLKSGDKIKNNKGIPEWVFSSNNYLKACIRGLIDTDGSVTPITNRNYTYIWFTNKNAALRDDFERAMKILGYKISKWNFSGTPETYIGNKKGIRKFYKEIGFNNPKHKQRFMMPL
tara:strand:+ start:246 stop:1148 length:903 start_codon:yes stop_codon:yes gene_type:complete